MAPLKHDPVLSVYNGLKRSTTKRMELKKLSVQIQVT